MRCGHGAVSAAIAVFGACSAEPADRGPSELLEPPVQSAMPAPRRPAPVVLVDRKGTVFTAAELSRWLRLDPYRYPPIACRLKALLGSRFSLLVGRGGLYQELDDLDGGYVYRGLACPQTGCDGALVWADTDGRMFVLLQEGSRIELYSNDPELLLWPHRMVLDEIRGVESESWRTEPVVVARPRATRERLPDPVECSDAALEDATRRYLGARDGQLCDAEFSWFGAAAAVVPIDHRAHFHALPSTERRRPSFLVHGDLVTLGQELGGFRCAQYVSLDGTRTVGWLPNADLRELPRSWRDQLPDDGALAGFAPPDAGKWLTTRPRTLGDLQLRRVDSAHVHVDLTREMAGHVCGIEQALDVRPGGILRADPERDSCRAVAMLFRNGVNVWEDGSCSGVRATCADAYTVEVKRLATL